MSDLAADILAVLRDGVRERVFPGAVAAVFSGDGETCIPCGHETYEPDAPPIRADSIFDIASLTKLVTATAVMQLAERGKLALDDPACRFLPRLATPPRDRITVAHLLGHSAGFPGGEPLRGCASRAAIRDAIDGMELLYAPGSGRIYDDIGYILLGLIVESVSGLPLDRYCAGAIFAPLEMTETMFNPPRALLDRIVPTEIDPARGGLVRGVVHDERAATLDGVAGHAGLFSTVRDLGRFARAMLACARGAPEGVLGAASVRRMWARHWQDGEGEYGLGWDRLRPSYMDAIDDPDAVGHTGFTGVSLVISPRRDLAMILLSNRVHPRRGESDPINRIRRRFVQAALRPR